MLQNVGALSLLELGLGATCARSTSRSRRPGRQSLLEDGRIGCFPCLLHFSPDGEEEKPVCHVENVEEFIRNQLDKAFSVLL